MSVPQIPNDQSLQEIFEAHKAMLLSIVEEEIKKPFIVRERALELTHHLREAFAPLLPKLEEEFSPKRVSEIETAYEQLVVYLFLFYAASMTAEKPWTEQNKADFQRLIRQVRDNDIRYMKWSRALFHGDKEKNELLDQIQRGRGYQDDAEDVIALTQLLLSSNLPFPNGFIEEKELRTAEADARRCLWLLTGQDNNKAPKGSPHDLWHRAYTLWAQTYNALARVGHLLTKDPKEAAQRFPRIHPAKKNAPSAKETDNQNVTPSV
ncbi:MAG: hypothetical protein AAGJ35_00435 [Myxococcota bacterium]